MKPKIYYKHQELFINGALEALYKIGNVLTSSKKLLEHNMYSNGWQLTKAAEADFRQVVANWCGDNYEKLCEMQEAGNEPWDVMGGWFICSVQREGTGYWDAQTGKTVNRERLALMGNELHQVATSAFNEETFWLYIKAGRYCEFQYFNINNLT